MSVQSTVFPAFIRAEYDGGNGFAQFEQGAANAARNAQKQFEGSFAEIGNVLSKAVSSGLNKSGSIDLNLEGFRQAKAEATAYSETLRETVQSANFLAKATGDTSEATKRYLQALSAQVIEAQQSEAAASAQVATYTRLQSALEISASRVGRLSDSYRGLYAEQARAAQGEVRSSGIQSAFEQVFSPGLNRPAKSASDSASVFADAAIITDANAKQAASYDALRLAEQNAARSADLLTAIHRGTALEAGRVSTTYADVAAAFAEADRQAAKLVISQQELRAAEAALATEAGALRQALDPMLAVQQRFDAEMVRADRLMEAGAISTREYADAQRLARQNLQDSAKAVAGHGDAIERETLQKKQGTTATQVAGNTLGAQRYAYIQANQQLQDIAVSLQGGQKAATVFAQQLPQLAFVLSGVGGTAGKIASFFAGGWGTAILVAGTVLGPLIAKLFDTDDATKKAAASTIDFTTVLETKYSTIEKFKDIIDQLNKATHSLIDTQALLIDSSAESAKALAATATARIAAIDAETKQIAANRTNELPSPVDLVTGNRTQSFSQRAQLSKLAAERQSLLGQVALASVSAVEAEIGLANRSVNETVDKVAALKGQYDRTVALLTQKRVKSGAIDADISAGRAPLNGQGQSGASYVSKAEFERQILALRNKYDADVKAAQAALRETKNGGTFSDFLRPVTGGTITGRFGEQRSGHVHAGTDYAVPVGTPVRAPAAGTVDVAGNRQGYGNAIYINFGGGTSGRFGHLSKFNVKPGDSVNAGDIIGYTGGAKGAPGSGDSSGPHLHYEVRRGNKAVNPATGRFPTDAGGASDDAEKIRKQLEQLDQFGRGASDAIANLVGRFDDAPRAIDAAHTATLKLDEIITQLAEKRPPGFEDMIASAERAKGVVEESLNRPLREYLKVAAERKVTDEAYLAGGVDRATAMSQVLEMQRAGNVLGKDALATVLQTVEAERRRALVVRDQQALMQAYVQTVNDVRSALEQTINSALNGKLTPGSLFKNIQASFNNLLSKQIMEKLFGDAFRSVEDGLAGGSKVQDASTKMASAMDDGSEGVTNFAAAISEATDNIRRVAQGVPSSGAASSAASSLFGAANDNKEYFKNVFNDLVSDPTNTNAGDADIVVTATRKAIAATSAASAALSPTKTFAASIGKPIDALVKLFGGGATQDNPGGFLGLSGKGKGPDGTDAVKTLGTRIGSFAAKGLEGAAVGGAINSFLAPIGKALGFKTSKTGAEIGGAIGGMTNIPGLKEIGSVVGSIVGGLFKKSPSGSAVITSVTGSSKVTGTSEAIRTDMTGAASSVQASLEKMIESLGGAAGAFNVSIGQYKDYFRVSGDGRANVGTKDGNSGKSDLLYDGTDANTAIQIAIQNAIQDGAIVGIKKGAQNLLAAGKDLEAQLTKALKFQSVFTELKSFTDPVGAALDALNLRFVNLKGIFDEAGASTQDYADLETLYGLNRAKAIKDASAAFTGALLQLKSDLLTGDNGLSLRDRLANAKATYDPLAADIAAGKTVDADAFATAARSVLDIQRQLSGSQSDYFSLFDQITGLTTKALAAQDAIIANAVATTTPFDSTTGGTTTGANDNTQTVSAIDAMNAAIVAAIQSGNTILAASLKQLTANQVAAADQTAALARQNF